MENVSEQIMTIINGCGQRCVAKEGETERKELICWAEISFGGERRKTEFILLTETLPSL